MNQRVILIFIIKQKVIGSDISAHASVFANIGFPVFHKTPAFPITQKWRNSAKLRQNCQNPFGMCDKVNTGSFPEGKLQIYMELGLAILSRVDVFIRMK
jgi:hypothetical protein